MRKNLLSVLLILSMTILVTTTALWAEDNDEKEEKSVLNSGTFSGLELRSIGPAFMSGRIGDIAVDPNDTSTWYLAVSSGNVWKTTNTGTTWSPIFDNYGSYSIGCVTIDPNDSNVIWVGTGENNSQRSVGYGDGIYKSTNAGKSFKKAGLGDSQHVAKILVDPRDSNVVYAAAQGPLWNNGGDRGLYKTTDGGENWEAVLEIDEHTGVSDIVFDPRNPDVIYAASYQRRRHVWTLIDGGPGSGIHKTSDGGKTWTELNSGLPGSDKGRIGLAISPIDPDVVYAIVEAQHDQGGFFRSADAGASWQKRGKYISGSPQYYQEIVADPHVFDRVYSLDTYMMVSEDGGKNFVRLGEQWKHVDNHAMYIDPKDPEHLIIGSDGGLYETWDRGKSYRFFTNLPITQFYKVAVDNDLPFYNIYGGTQDNATQGGPSRTNNIHGITNNDWFITVFGDGFDPAIDPENPDIVYSQWQYGGLIRYDRGSGETVDIRPQPEKGEDSDRWNWDAAILISPHKNTRLYYASQRVYRSEDRGDSWTRISDDLSRTEVDRNTLKVMGRVWSVDAVAKNVSTSIYGNIVSIMESPLQENLLYAGTDDGVIQVTENGGESWTRYDIFPEVPDMSYVNDLEADLFDAGTLYAAFNNHKKGDFKPYILKSIDKGQSWTNISGDLPERGSVYAIKQDHVNKNLLFAGTEFGIFFTLNGGQKWIQLKSGIPVIAIRDVEIQRRENDLVLASFGRSFYVLDDYSPLREATEEVFEKEATIFPVKKALLYSQATPLSYSEKGFQGADFYNAPNPPFGAIFTYHLKDSYKTKKQNRHTEEGKIKKDGGDVSYPSWEGLKEEDREENPALIFTVKDSDGNIVRRFTAPASKGLKRIAWDLRYSSLGSRYGRGPLVVPGEYSVGLTLYADNEYKDLGAEQTFQVEALSLHSLAPQDRKASFDFQMKVGELFRVISGTRSALDEANKRIEAIKDVLLTTPGSDTALMEKAREMELQLIDLQESLAGDETKTKRAESGPVSLWDRLQSAGRNSRQTYGPTATHRHQYEIAAEEFEVLLPQLRQFVEVDLPALEEQLEALGAAWTPGRKIPNWKK